MIVSLLFLVSFIVINHSPASALQSSEGTSVSSYQLKEEADKPSDEAKNISYQTEAPLHNEFLLLSETYYENPSVIEIKQLLTEKALANNVPPELLKAIAWQESGWRQFDGGEPYTGYDPGGTKGYGILQVTPGKTGITEVDDDVDGSVERLKTDIEYNIDIGIEVLLQKWNWTDQIIPKINDRSWEKLNHWYFATMAYNGLSAVNDPNLDFDRIPYQTKIFGQEGILREQSLLNISEFPTYKLEISYSNLEPTEGSSMDFSEKMQYDLFGPMTKTKYLFNEGNKVKTVVSAPALRDAPRGNFKYPGEFERVPVGEVITVTGSFEYDDRASNHFVWYPVKVKDGDIERTGYVASSYLMEAEQRIYGQTRYETAVLLSQQGWSSANTVVLARGDDFPDALAGAPLAKMLNAPMLLSKTDELPRFTKQEIKRLGAETVVILGGHLAINSDVEDELKSMGIEIDRIEGSTRFQTAKLIADRLGNEHEEVIVINVDAFADAMAIAPYSARNGVPILLTRKDQIHHETRAVLDYAETTILLGADLVISEEIVSEMPNPRRFDGHTRFDTAAQIVRELHSSNNNAFLVSGFDFPDGLTGAVLAAANKGDAIILTHKDKLPSVTKDIMEEYSHVTIVGGPLAISDDVVAEVMNR